MQVVREEKNRLTELVVCSIPGVSLPHGTNLEIFSSFHLAHCTRTEVFKVLFFAAFQKLIQSMSAKEIELQRLNNGKSLLEQRLDELMKQKEREQAVSPK